MTLAAGTRLGPYEITAKLGEGGMGEVWRARDTKLERDVAIKVLPAAFVEDHERLARFEREAKLLAQLNHPNIAQIYGMEASGDSHALVMELVEGPTLAERLETGPLPLDESLSLARQIAEALEEAHEKGIIHRDLKPQNIKASIEGQVKVLDFGLAKAMDPTGAASGAASASQLAASPTLTLGATQMGVVLGTAAYMSPEQAKGLAVDKRADIWAFGVVLYEMLTGISPFVGDTVPDTLANVINREIDLSGLAAVTPPAIQRLVRRCLERNPKNRLHDIADARLVIEDAGSGRLVETVPSGAGAPGVVSGARAALPWVISSVLAVALAALGAWVWLGRPSDAGSPRLVFEQKTFHQAAIFNARFAGDGKTIVYSSAEQGSVPRLSIIRPEYPEPQPYGPEATHLLSISARDELAVLSQARWIGHRQFEGTLGRMPLGGGAPRDLVDRVREADWLPDGDDLAIVHDVGGRDRLEFPIGNTVYETSGYFSDLRVSPLGDLVAFFDHDTRFDDRGSLAVVDRTGKRTVLASGYESEEGLAWRPDGLAIFYTARTDRFSETHLVDLEGRDRVVMPLAGGVTIQDLSRSGRRLFTRDDRSTQTLVRLPGEAVAREYGWLDYSVRPLISRDGRLLAITDNATTGGRNYQALLRKTDGSPFVRLGEGTALALSPDGGSLAVSVLTSPLELVIYPTGTGQPKRLERGQLEAVTAADWFADGNRLLLSGNESGQPSRCFVLSIDDGSSRPVTPEGTSRCKISPDGRQVAASSADGHVEVYSLEGDSSRAMPGLGPDHIVMRWSPDGKALWFFSRTELPIRAESLEVETGRRTTIETIDFRNPVGVLQAGWLSLADDPSIYALGNFRQLSLLFVAEEVP